MSQGEVPDRIRWCEVLVGDVLVLRKQAETLQRRAARWAALTAPVGSGQHVEARVRLLLARGEDAVAQSDACEDILMRALPRLFTLLEWAYRVGYILRFTSDTLRNQISFTFLQGCMHLHKELTDRQTRDSDGLGVPQSVLLEAADQQRQQAANQQLAATVESGQKTWGQVLLGPPVKSASLWIGQ